MRNIISVLALLAASVSAVRPEKIAIEAREIKPIDDVLHKTPVDNEFGSFIAPRKFPLSYVANKTYNIRWNSTFESCDLVYYKQGMPGGFAVSLEKNITNGTYEWSPTKLAWRGTGPFVFRVYGASQYPVDPTSNASFISVSWYFSYDGSKIYVKEDGNSTSGGSSSTNSTRRPASPTKFSNSTTSSTVAISSPTSASSAITPTITPASFLTDIPSIPPVDPIETGVPQSPGSGANALASVGWSITLVLFGILYMLL